MELSLFYPAFNEAENIEKSVKRALAVLPKITDRFEIIVVNDGSTDSTLDIARELARRHKEVRVISQENRGYGGALKTGFAAARFNWIFYTDADLQFDLGELKKLIKATPDNDLIIGFRHNRAEGWKRHILAVALKYWNWLFFSFPSTIRDVDCAFKLINKQVIEHIYPLECDGAMISTELLLKAHIAGFRISQMPVSHYPRRFGKPTGNNFRVILGAIRETMLLQKILLFGRRQAAYETSWR